MSEKSAIHKQAEDEIRTEITNGDSNYEVVGREENSNVAEAMAYAAKPLIDVALADLQLEPNQGLAEFEIDGKKFLNKEPGVVTKRGWEVPYTDIKDKVAEAHQEASKVQVDYYDKIDAARRA